MARPLISPNELRDKFDVYLNPTELGIIDANAKSAGLSLSAFIRRSALNQKISSVPTGNIQHWQELARVSANLNQIAKHLNEGFHFEIDAEVIHRLRELVEALRLDLMRGGDDSEA